MRADRGLSPASGRRRRRGDLVGCRRHTRGVGPVRSRLENRAHPARTALRRLPGRNEDEAERQAADQHQDRRHDCGAPSQARLDRFQHPGMARPAMTTRVQNAAVYGPPRSRFAALFPAAPPVARPMKNKTSRRASTARVSRSQRIAKWRSFGEMPKSSKKAAPDDTPETGRKIGPSSGEFQSARGPERAEEDARVHSPQARSCRRGSPAQRERPLQRKRPGLV